MKLGKGIKNFIKDVTTPDKPRVRIVRVGQHDYTEAEYETYLKTLPHGEDESVFVGSSTDTHKATTELSKPTANKTDDKRPGLHYVWFSPWHGKAEIVKRDDDDMIDAEWREIK